jgi:glutaminyl-tRNA synthetase
VDASSAVPATFNHFDFLILDQYVSSENFMERINPNSWTVYHGFVERALANAKPGDKFQFIRDGYYNTDDDAKETELIFNRTVSLKSSFKTE